MKNKNIIIQCWSGKILFEGPYTSKEVDKVLDANRCDCKDSIDCNKCDDTGYVGDFEVYWSDETNTENVFDYINY